jgi:agmatinase
MLLVKVPINCGALSKKKGVDKGPDSIVKQFDELFLNESFEEINPSVQSISIDNYDIDGSYSIIEEKAKEFMKKGKVGFLGGDHSLTYSTIKAFSKLHKSFALVIFDAHPDLEDSKLTHEDYLRNLITEDIISSEKVILIGLRNMSINEYEFLKKNNINYFTMSKIFDRGIKEIISELTEKLKGYDEIYLSIDIDAVDPAFAPGTGYIEPGGLTSREILQVIKSLRDKVVAFDVVEVNPNKDFNEMTAKLAAKLILELGN